MANSLKDLISSVDWRKAMSGTDARNALIGSALGGALLGGASLMQDRDPEESKLAPVGDALMGAVLGGVAGYGIPKGLALFRDSGSLAPNGDKLKSNYLGWGAGGALAGAGLFGAGLSRTLSRGKQHALEEANRTYAGNLARAMREVDDAYNNGLSQAEIRRLQDRVAVLGKGMGGAAEAERTITHYRGNVLSALRRGDIAEAKRNWKLYKELRDYKNANIRGYVGLRDLARHASVADASGEASSTLGWLWKKLTRTGAAGPSITHGAHYATRAPWWTLWSRVQAPHRHMIARGTKYALGGTALALLAHKLLGPSASNNYKK